MFAKSWSLLLIVALAISTAAVPGAEEDKAKNEPKPQRPVTKKVAKSLQDTSVTIRAGMYSGSGTMVQTADGQIWIWTAGHVVAHLRNSREILDSNGSKRVKVEFDDAKILRFNKDADEGRIVSSYSGDAQIVRYSDSNYGHDLALLRLRDKDFKPSDSAKFYLDKPLPEIGDDLYHCGSLLGPMGSNSLTSGVYSQHGRVFDGKIYDQTNATSFPGSSGGVVALKEDGRYVGMLVMGAGEGFSLFVPVRRMLSWAKAVGVEFALDPSKPVPSDEDLFKKPVEDSSSDGACANCKQRTEAGYKWMVYNPDDKLAKKSTLWLWFARPGLIYNPERE